MMLSSLPHRFYRLLIKIFCILYLSLKVEGLDNIPKEGSFILAGNHISLLDPEVFGVSCPRLLNYMAKDSLFKNKLFAFILRSCFAFPVKRNFSDIGAIREALGRLKRGGGLIVFPQGTRKDSIVLDQALAGIGFLARKSRAVVIPAYVAGTHEVLPIGSKFIKPGKVKVIFGKGIKYDDNFSGDDLDFSKKIVEKIIELKNVLKDSNK